MSKPVDRALSPVPGGVLNAVSTRLTAAEFHGLADVPPEAEWFANIDNPQTRRAYRNDLREFMAFVGISAAGEFRVITRSHIIAWRKDLEGRQLAGSTVRRKLAALSSLFEFLCEANAVPTNPVKGVKRPRVESYEGKTPALGDHQAKDLLQAPDPTTLKGKRDRAILSVFLFHGLRREEVATLKVKDIRELRGVKPEGPWQRREAAKRPAASGDRGADQRLSRASRPWRRCRWWAF